ncbi:hypothetical protein CLV51_107181 [Chitinophaga niastensis]|uniref:Uncharacterized protein n=1 Tax=Chitinophaga niastensis TaxID=536980 RepID=A0A2P8HCB1_CHINA|nr:hypothetical protein CLV51_107181 [Chitinophaga niastensis]
MKKESVKKLSLSMIKVTRLSSNAAQLIRGGNAISGPVGPTGPTTVQPDPCASQYQACTMDCTFGCTPW